MWFCGGLIENSLIVSSVWILSSSGKTVCEGLHGVALLEKIFHWGQGWGFKRVTPLLAFHQCFLLVDHSVNPHFLQLLCLLLPSLLWWEIYPLKLQVWLKTFFHKLPCLQCFITSIKSWLRQGFPVNSLCRNHWITPVSHWIKQGIKQTEDCLIFQNIETTLHQ